MVIEVDQADGRFQVGKKRRREVVIVTGANEENFRARIGWQGPLRQALGEALPGFFGGPPAQLRARGPGPACLCAWHGRWPNAGQSAPDRQVGSHNTEAALPAMASARFSNEATR